ncbi:glutamine synthetase [Roseovarius spongiae]|uniref:Glutamine synthetase n=1 Tax=Roseovarius spongiae TaxID=2320272 RepID=A0A3A8AVX0_9RHOB|nr:glutamine synthetase [Roseovarius spongiae]RKF15308.1 glutamine synthetase [Roseovarius spongiae]
MKDEVTTTDSQARDDFVMLGYVDFDGLIRGKYVSASKFASIKEKGSVFCSVVLGWDSRDELFDNAYTGWFNGFPDDAVRMVPETRRTLPGDGRDFYLLEFTGDGRDLCPRNLAGRMVARAAEAGFTVRSGFEYEFFVFRESPRSAMEKGYRDLTPLSPTTGGYSVLRTVTNRDLFSGLMGLAHDLGTPLEAIHPEAGEGAMEFALAPSEGIEAADRAAIFKTFSKAWGQEHDLLLCYMAKPITGLPGCGGHYHLSLMRDGAPAFWSEEAPDNLSQTARHFIGGQQKYMPELLALISPTINAFTRLAPGFWAPTGATWGFDNRTCSLRVVGDAAKSLRVEHRPAAADANPYLVQAAALASGLAGIEEGIEPTEPTRDNAYEADMPEALKFPSSLAEAAARLRGSRMARDWFGSRFVDQFATSREAEQAACRAAVSDWELHRYFEMI